MAQEIRILLGAPMLYTRSTVRDLLPKISADDEQLVTACQSVPAEGETMRPAFKIALSVVALIIVMSCLATCGGPRTSAPAIDTAAQQTRIMGELADYSVHDVYSSGTTVIVTINATAESLGGKSLAEDAAKPVARAVFSREPAVLNVEVKDGNGKMIGLWNRAQ